MSEPMTYEINAQLFGAPKERGKTPSRKLADYVLRKVIEYKNEEGNENKQAILDFAIVMAGINSTDPAAQALVQPSLAALVRTLPALQTQSEKMEAVMNAVGYLQDEVKRYEAQQGRMKASANDQTRAQRDRAGARSHLVSALLQPDQLSGPASTRMVADIHEKVGRSIASMKEDLDKEEEKLQKEREEEGGDEVSARSYLLGLTKLYTNMSKAALPHLVTMCDALNIDLFKLSGEELKHLFGDNRMVHIAPMYTATLNTLAKCKAAIVEKKKDEESIAVRTVSGLHSIMSGKVPAGIYENGENESVFDCIPHYCTKVNESSIKCSELCDDMKEGWTWLKTKYEEGRNLEKKVDKALAESEDPEYLMKMKKELKRSALSYRRHVKALTQKIVELADDGSDSD